MVPFEEEIKVMLRGTSRIARNKSTREEIISTMMSKKCVKRDALLMRTKKIESDLLEHLTEFSDYVSVNSLCQKLVKAAENKKSSYL